MASLFDVSREMSDYLLKGWTLTNDPCPICGVPMVKSPLGSGSEQDRELRCANCEALRSSSREIRVADQQNLLEQRQTPSKAYEGSSDKLSVSTRSPSIGRKSTPPTDISPPRSPEFTLPPPTQEQLARREQSDRAAQEIGSKLLQGWTMLGDECPNPTCYGVPLVRAPNDTVKVCVICGNRYISENEAQAMGDKPTSVNTTKSNEIVLENATTNGKGKERASPEEPSPGSLVVPGVHDPSTPFSTTMRHSPKPIYHPTILDTYSAHAPRVSVLHSLPEHLEQSLVVLERKLIDATSSGNVRRIGEVADAISKVTVALKGL